MSATGDYVGGLIGDNRIGGSVSNSSAAGTVSAGKGASGAAVQNLGLMLGIPVNADLPAARPILVDGVDELLHPGAGN